VADGSLARAVEATVERLAGLEVPELKTPAIASTTTALATMTAAGIPQTTASRPRSARLYGTNGAASRVARGMG
jgi:hypothetical protein